ncbi:AMP-binding protein [Virgibacillus sp. DJP39]|uniref:AMP-binding protein n=1 Tax=Virgibacillus sp. DJP39 TaxID=3409790 RepID=UPI003BB6B7A3
MSKILNVKSLDLAKIDNLRTLTERAAARWGDKVGLVFDEFNQQLTFREIDERSNQIANVLRGLGVEPGNRVAVMMKNRLEFPLTWLAIGKIGAIMVPINSYYKEFDAQYLLEHSEATIVVTSSEFIALLQNIKTSVKTLKQIVSVEQDSNKDVLNLSLLSSQVSVQPPEVPLYPETVINIQYTSGTTGRPKGCMLTHNYWLAIGRTKTMTLSPGINESDILLTAQPFYYMDPQWNFITTLASGATLIILDRFHPSTFWEKVREYNVTFFYCLGMMPALMLKMPVSPDDANNQVRHISCSAIPKHLHQQLEKRWNTPWFEVFGMTETGGDISITQEEHDVLVGTGCLGRINPDKEIRIMNDQDQVLPRGEIGEMVIRGIGIMEGYYKNQEATNKAFRNGFFHTGDLAYMDEKGLIYYAGRKKEMIRRSGENISAAEVEEAIKLYPDVNYAAVIPIPDELRGDEIKAYVVLNGEISGHTEIVKELIKFCSERLAYFKVPRYWEFRPELPLTPSERVAKHKLLEEKSDLRIDSYDHTDGTWRTR